MAPMFKTLALALGSAVALSSHADIVTYTGTTAAAPTYNRAVEDFSALSGVGTNVRYDARSFTVSTSGDYTFLTTGRFDTFSFLYSPSFGTLAPLTNGLIGNDDLLPGFTTSGFTFALAAGVNYTYVTTGFENSDSGIFSNTFGGPGTISLTGPAPSPAATPNITTFTGDTSSSPTFNRAFEDFSGLSQVGTAVRYDAYQFRVGTAGEYTFLSTAGFDSFAFLYSPTFGRLTPLVNGLIGDDDLLDGFTTSGFAFNLVPGVDYTYVTTGFENSDSGFFSNTIGGPGAIIPAVVAIPEPEIVALLGGGLALLGWRARRQKRFATR